MISGKDLGKVVPNLNFEQIYVCLFALKITTRLQKKDTFPVIPTVCILWLCF